MDIFKNTIVAVGTAAIVSSLTWANWHTRPITNDSTATRIIVDKSDYTLLLMSSDSVLKSYSVSFGANPLGHKQHEGDERTPEGTYQIDWRNDRSGFYRALHISYPDSTDIARASAAGVSPGGQIMIHGLRNGLGWIGKFHRLANWTDGCIAVTNSEIDEIWHAVEDGTPIEIRP